MSFSLIYICCSFRGAFYLLFFYCSHISDPQGTWSALVSFPILSASLSLSFCFYNVPFPSFSSMSVFIDLYVRCMILSSSLSSSFSIFHPSFCSMSFSLIYICCSFRGGILSVVFPHCSHMFLTRREPGVPLSLFRSYPLPFSPPFLLYCSLPFPFFYAFFIDPYLL